MPRKSSDIPESEPPTPTRRSSRLSVAPSDDEASVTSMASTSSAVKKSTRARKIKTEEQDPLPTIDETSITITLDPITPRRGRKSKKTEEILDDEQQDLSQQEKQHDTPRTPERSATPVSVKLVTPIQEKPKVASPVRPSTPTPQKQQTASVTAISPKKFESAAPVVVPPIASPQPSFNDSSNDVLLDGDEIVAIWAQCHRALSFGWNTIGPVFASVIFVLTLFGLFTASQFIAIIGIVYVVFGGLILCSYAICMVPFILFSRLFTQIIDTGCCCCEGSAKYVNLCCRLLLFSTIFLLAATLIVGNQQVASAPSA